IIQLGNKIGSPTTQKYYTEELIDKTNIVVKSFPDYFDNSTDYHDSFFDQLVMKDISQNDAKLFLLSKAMFVHESNCRFLNFSEEVYKTFTNEMFMNNDDVFIDEVNFNVRIIFPIIQSLVRNMDNMRFLPGETRLKAVSKELKLLSNDTTHYYNADGILSLRSSNLEIALLETTGKLNVEDRPKEVKDYIKAGYGLVSMLHNIGRLYHYADFKIFRMVSVYFIQVTRKWSHCF
ncbi:uncharacterized protein B0P05DRAFT_472289, partial [Gilbertella persicaria]|uniref:uncharacterized protein n=1 Tax=Gilbertella persicaria TaxID=101096 RepID=UPI00221E9178